jgi:hypothetical protein
MATSDHTMLTTSSLRERGWTPAMIRDLLGEPDELRRNPYRPATDMRLWSVARVAEAESAPAFAERRAEGERWSAASRRGAERRRDELVERVRAEPPPRVPSIRRDKLIRQACDSYNARQRAGPYVECWASAASDPEFLKRIMVNYLRHELTDYERRLDMIAGQIGCRDAHQVIRQAVYSAIAGAYPDLAAECDRQEGSRR